ncbi:type IV conjugative transfer system pilin TraA [Erwinia tasmaniensis]|uniref:Pilin n=1 Tax=Erwinia tasmaniensis (strain DSM 17950 / CFBP 7177 / CIP 109463 / NCPPB 4357 / Et1/99) TaxID=465817 RepID=B2VB05_ERWT9|nr:type IV conjugative transfer system pilin TraA [Erwinia tasmaniensis]CAO94953.1 TraA protein [Erwinia tasmaniensis Et1/99]
MKRALKSILNFSRANKKKLSIVMAAVTVCMLPEIAFSADSSTDLLQAQQATINSTFGHGSSLEKYFYIAEVFMSLIAYFRARTPMVFIGLIMVIIFTRIAFGIIG